MRVRTAARSVLLPARTLRRADDVRLAGGCIRSHAPACDAGLGARLAALVLAPLAALHAGTRRIAKQQFGEPVVISTKDEFGDVATSFNAMADQIHTQLDALRRLAYFDTLTGLPNRASFTHKLTTELERNRAEGDLVGVLLLDLDHFSRINDTLGHEAGDHLLQQVAARLRACCREREDDVAHDAPIREPRGEGRLPLALPVTDDRLKQCLIETIDILVGLLEVNDPFFGGNSHITMEYARSVAEEMKLSQEMVDEIVVASLLHDIGRIGIKSEILTVKKEITESEFKTIQSHCENGAKIIDARPVHQSRSSIRRPEATKRMKPKTAARTATPIAAIARRTVVDSFGNAGPLGAGIGAGSMRSALDRLAALRAEFHVPGHLVAVRAF